MATDTDTDTDTCTVPLTLELLGGKIEGHDSLECRRVPTTSGFKLQLLLPGLIDLDVAANTADMLLSSIEIISNNVMVDRVEVSNLRFTPEGVSSLIMFLAIQATSVKHLVLKNVIGGPNITITDQEAFTSLGLAFQESRLETLDLGSNVLGSYIWKSFSSQTQLQSLFLEDVEMDDESFEVLDMHLEKKMNTGILSRVCISNNAVTTEKAAQAGNNIIYRCTNLRAIRWLNKNAHARSSCRLPCRGIHELAQKSLRLSTQLRHLELEGGELRDEESDVNVLCEGLKLLHRLNHLKLRNLSITPNQATQLVDALRTGRIPLRNLDLSNNKLGDEGAAIIGQLADIRTMVTNLKYLNIESNDIGNQGGIQLFIALGSRDFDDLDIRTDGNRLDMVKVALGIAALKSEAEEQRDALRLELDQLKGGQDQQHQHQQQHQQQHHQYPGVKPEDQINVRHLLAAQASMVSDMQILRKEVEKLTDERDSLIKTFLIMGAGKHIEEHNSVLTRLSRLEEAVHCNRVSGRYPTKQVRPNMQRTPGLSPEEMRALEASQAAGKAPGSTQQRNMQPPGPVKRRPGAIKDDVRKEERMSRDDVRARIQAEVASLQKKKNEVRACIMSEVVALQSERRKQNEKTQALQAKIKEKLASKAVDRAKVLEDVVKLKQERGLHVKLKQERGLQRRESESNLLKRPEPDRSLLQRRESKSFSEKSLRRKEPFSEKGIPRNRRESYSRSGSEMLEAGGPTILIPDSSSHSEGRHKIGQSTSDRFQRLLHKQIQNQLFKSTARNSDSLKSESERDSSHDTVLASDRRTLSKGQEDSSRSLTGDTSTRSPSLRTFIANDGSRGQPPSGGSGISLPFARSTTVNRDPQLDDSATSLQLTDLSHPSPTKCSSTKSTPTLSVKTMPTSPSKKSTTSPSKKSTTSPSKKSTTSPLKISAVSCTKNQTPSPPKNKGVLHSGKDNA
jgi:hypothetical protein